MTLASGANFNNYPILRDFIITVKLIKQPNREVMNI